MNIQNLVRETLAANMGTLGAESVTIDGQAVDAVMSEVDQEASINGGRRVERNLTGQFPTDKSIRLKTGMAVHVGGKKWKLERFQKGQAMTSINLIEPNRIEE